MEKVRAILAEKLRDEMERKGLDPSAIADGSNLSSDVIKAYLLGQRELHFAELRPICDALGTDLLWQLSAGHATSKLVYRKTGRGTLKRAAAVESAFSLIADFLCNAKRPDVDPVPDSDTAAIVLILQIEKSIQPLREHFTFVENLYEEHRLPVLGISAGDEFDGFLAMLGKKAVVCANIERPNVRLEFTLLHEFAHFAFDAKRNIPVDTGINPSDYYQDEISPDIRHEYIANKFAQFFMVPLGVSQVWARARDPERQAAQYAQDRGVSAEVAANALRDAFLLGGKREPYAKWRDSIRAEMNDLNGRSAVRDFVLHSTRSLHDALCLHRDRFGDSRWKELSDAWEVNCDD